MSKIPQGQWSAIAARHAQGESISRIAQSYGCTPPAIHYILKRSRQRNTSKEQLADVRPQSPPAPGFDQHGVSRAAAGGNRANPAQPVLLRAGAERLDASAGPAHREIGQPLAPLQQAGARSSQTSAITAGLDRELHGRAEAAIEAFRLSFDAALAEGSPLDRQRLRQAASDLMRVAARTTIVLDRLNASAERASIPAQNRFVPGL